MPRRRDILRSRFRVDYLSEPEAESHKFCDISGAIWDIEAFPFTYNYDDSKFTYLHILNTVLL